jgi:uncharacterized membrane protein (UPF0127 family)
VNPVLKAVDRSTGNILAGDVRIAGDLFSRMRGLLGKKELPPGQGLLIKPCNSIHTIGMRFAIDAVFLDRDNRVVATISALPPNRLTRLYFRATSVLELPPGTIDKCATAVGDEFEFVY